MTKLLGYLLFVATTVMIVNPETTIAAAPIQASARMLQYKYWKMDIVFGEDIRARAPEPRTQQEFEALHRKASEGGPDSNYLLSRLYMMETPMNLEYDPSIVSEEQTKFHIKEGLRFLQRTLQLNPRHPLALYRTGVAYESGKVVPKDYEKAIYYYDLAARNGFGYAAHNLFEVYMIGYGGIPKDTAKARFYADLAKELGSNFHKYTTENWDDTLKYYERFDKNLHDTSQ